MFTGCSTLRTGAPHSTQAVGGSAPVLLHALARSLHEPRARADLVHLSGGCVAPHVLLLQYLLQAGAVAEAVDDVLHHPLFPRGVILDAEQAIPEGPVLPLLGHTALLSPARSSPVGSIPGPSRVRHRSPAANLPPGKYAICVRRDARSGFMLRML